MAPATSKTNLKLANDAEEDWSGWADPKQRRKVQNRLNQRATRQRKASEKKQAQQSSASKPTMPTLRSLRPKLVDHDDRALQLSEASQALLLQQRIPPPMGAESLRNLHPVFANAEARKLFHTGTTQTTPSKQHKLKASALVMWPMMGHILMPDREPIERVLFKKTIEDDLRLDATIYAQWTVMFAQNTTEKRTPLLALNRVLKKVREAIATGTVTDTIIFCILVLSAKPLQPTLLNSLGHGLFQPPAPQTGCIDHIGAVECHGEHMDVLRRLVQERGGISKIKTPSLPEHLQYIDLLDSSQLVTTPAFEFCFSYNHVLETDMTRCRLPFSHADSFPVDDHFKKIILDLLRCCQILDDDLCNEPQGADQKTLSYRMLPTYREIVHHRLLTLPRGHPDTEICRLATLIFSYGVTLPLPNQRPIRSLVQQLREALTTPCYAENQSDELLFWANMLGAMASFNCMAEDDLHAFFLDKLRALATKLAVCTWEAARVLLEKFVWLSRACDGGARYVWENLLVDHAYDGVVVRFPQLAI